MTKQETLRRIHEIGLVAVLRGLSPELTIKMVDALVEGGVQAVEITYSTPSAAHVVTALDKQYGEHIVLGMGTLTELAQVDEARAAGAQFLVTPHCDPMLARALVVTGLPAMIGALTPTEVELAHHLGSDVVKIFPASLVGPGYLKSLRGPFPHIPTMPTGGVSADNVGEWFAAGAFAVAAGSELCPTGWAKEGRFSDITQRAKEFCEAVRQARRRE
ncbi:MAG: bifunctional 4-hydroxy-2-oxoglutarate aldolase/2-dehydro-3-deoxy-phosphogluconate aldolase [Chloroflexi bacterium]|nr:bifunctional 4-hydroxy-2-oxoglutarate aldolase/2-dehydro-3-deoxy-phosphogluconate aldolase [Chloroflexota bacterium]